jgi:ketosteroid isomerase-like protein
MKKSIFTLLVIAIASLGKADGGVLNASNSATDFEELLIADQQFGASLAANGVQKAYLNFLADDGNIIAAGKPVITGRDAIRAFVAEETERNFSNWRALRAGVSGAGDMGYTSGAAEFSMKNVDGSQKSSHAVYLLFWKKQDRRWKIAALLINPARSAPTVLPDLQSVPPVESKHSKADIEQSLAAIIKADSDFSALSEARWAGEAFTSYIAADGVLVGLIGTGLKGAEAIRAAFGEKPSGGSLVWKPVKGEMSASCDLGFTIGYSTTKETDAEGKPRTSYGHYLTVWKKQTDGSWKFVLDGGNPSPQPK